MTDDRQRYKHFFRCRVCAERFSVIRLTASAEGLNPRCPRKSCGGKSRESHVPDIGMDVAAGKAPGVVGANVQVRAYDTAMEMTMTDQGMTNIQDHSRPGAVYRAGENTAPSLPMHLQQKVDSFWGGQQKKAKTARVDMSPIFGERATSGGPAPAQFKADGGSLIEPILKHRPTGSSPVPVGPVVADTNVGGRHILD